MMRKLLLITITLAIMLIPVDTFAGIYGVLKGKVIDDAGKPVIGFRVGGLPEIVIENKTGFLTSKGNIDKFSESILKVLTNDNVAERMKNECYAHSKRFSVQNHIKQLENMYTNLISTKNE